MKAKILKLEEKIFEGEVTKIVVPSVEGEMCILPNHISIITSLKKGLIKVFRVGIDRPLSIPVESGVCSFSANSAVFIL